MSPRRSSRARTTQPLPTSNPTKTPSSTSSISSGRAERSTRSHNKVSSPQTSAPPRSQSLEDPDEPSKPPPRRTRSGHDDIKDAASITPEDEDEEDMMDGDGDVTRCICGLADYPGLPGPHLEVLIQQARDSGASTEIMPEEVGGLFIQCDTCQVWQHGGCVGVFDESTTADEQYFCEECKKDLHRLDIAPNGQKYSTYLPLQDDHSYSTSPTLWQLGGGSRRSKDKSRATAAEALAQKRRSTMNSRDAAYDEGEQLRRAIEESKKDGGAPSVDNGSRRHKRSRSESEEAKVPPKRQRTSSDSSSHSFEKPLLPRASSSDEALIGKTTETSPKRIRGAAARNHRDKELREQKEKERLEAATRRKARSERRRGDDSDPSEDPTPAPNMDVQPEIETPPAPQDPPPKSHKKTGRPPIKRGRVGRNQYTKDRDVPLNSLDVTSESQTRGRSRSRSDIREPGEGVQTNGHTVSRDWGEAGKPSKPKHMNPNRTSLNEMKRRVAGILEFVSRTQVELDGRRGKGSTTTSPADTPPSKVYVNGINGADGIHGVQKTGNDGDSGQKEARLHDLAIRLEGSNGLDPDGPAEPAQRFERLSAKEMVGILKGRLVDWQVDYGGIAR